MGLASIRFWNDTKNLWFVACVVLTCSTWVCIGAKLKHNCQDMETLYYARMSVHAVDMLWPGITQLGTRSIYHVRLKSWFTHIRVLYVLLQTYFWVFGA